MPHFHSDPSRETSRQVHLAPYRTEEIMENTSNILTVKEVANILRCSKAHVHNAIHGKVQGLPKLTHLTMGRRKLVRRDWLEQWLETNKTR
jgi:excisionase family DNA binding protein